jgi:hypothetical protein
MIADDAFGVFRIRGALILLNHNGVGGLFFVFVVVGVGRCVAAIVLIDVSAAVFGRRCGGRSRIRHGAGGFLFYRYIFFRFCLALCAFTGREVNIIEKFFLGSEAKGYQQHHKQGC